MRGILAGVVFLACSGNESSADLFRARTPATAGGAGMSGAPVSSGGNGSEPSTGGSGGDPIAGAAGTIGGAFGGLGGEAGSAGAGQGGAVGGQGGVSGEGGSAGVGDGGSAQAGASGSAGSGPIGDPCDPPTSGTADYTQRWDCGGICGGLPHDCGCAFGVNPGSDVTLDYSLVFDGSGSEQQCAFCLTEPPAEYEAIYWDYGFTVSPNICARFTAMPGSGVEFAINETTCGESVGTECVVVEGMRNNVATSVGLRMRGPKWPAWVRFEAVAMVVDHCPLACP